MRIASRLACGVAGLALVASASAQAAPSFTKVADLDALGPGYTSNTYFGAPALDAGLVAFAAGDNSTAASGVYIGSGGALIALATETTPIPGGTGVFSGFGNPSISGSNVAFVGSFGGIYTWSAGVLSQVVVTGDTAPDGGTLSLPIAPSEGPSIEGTRVAFLAASSGASSHGYSFFSSDIANPGVLDVMAAWDTPVSGGGGDLFLAGPPSLDATGVAFQGMDLPAYGIYVADAGVARVVADQTTPIPGTAELFTSFSGPVASGSGNVAFQGLGTTVGGIYAEIGGMLVLVSGTERVSHQEASRGLSVSGDNVAYLGTDGFSPDGIYVYRDGQSQPLIRGGDTLDGRVINVLHFGHDGLSGNQVAFSVMFEDGSGGVYLATIPEPGSAGLLTVGLMVLAGRRRRQRPAR